MITPQITFLKVTDMKNSQIAIFKNSITKFVTSPNM